ncbi:zinc ribbon domain-containing protein [Bacteroidota bacterium]
MPTYEYGCKKCKKIFSVQMTISNYEKKKSIKCPNCRSISVRRIFSSFSAVTSSKS